MFETSLEILSRQVSTKMLWFISIAMFVCFLIIAIDVRFGTGCVRLSFYETGCDESMPVKLDSVYLMGTSMQAAHTAPNSNSARTSLGGAKENVENFQHISEETRQAMSEVAGGEIITKEALSELEGKIISDLQKLDATIPNR